MEEDKEKLNIREIIDTIKYEVLEEQKSINDRLNRMDSDYYDDYKYYFGGEGSYPLCSLIEKIVHYGDGKKALTLILATMQLQPIDNQFKESEILKKIQEDAKKFEAFLGFNGDQNMMNNLKKIPEQVQGYCAGLTDIINELSNRLNKLDHEIELIHKILRKMDVLC